MNGTTMEEQLEYVWRLAVSKQGDGTESSPHMFTAKKIISSDEFTQIDAALKLITELTEANPFKGLEDRYKAFREHLALVVGSDGKTGSREQLLAVPGKLDDLMSALKGFEDKTRHNLSKRYGKNSPQLDKFKAALSYEFDNVFAYRFCYQLRNYSQHVGSPIANTGVSSYFKDGKPVSVCELTIDPADLLDKYKKWQSKVKTDLQGMNGRKFSLDPILETLMRSCRRAYSKMLLAQELEIQNAVSVIRQVVGVLADDEWPSLTRLKKEIKTADDMANIQIMPINMGYVDLIERLIRQARAITS